MGTTAIFAEILIIGLEALAWVLLAVAAIVGPGTIDLGFVAENEGLTLLIVVAAAYVLGVMFDRTADSMLRGVDKRVDRKWKRYRVRPEDDVNTMRLFLMPPDLGVAPFLEYQRSRVRVARGTVFNLAVLILAANAYVVLNRSMFDRGSLAIALVVGNVIALATLIGSYEVYRRIAKAWIKMLNTAYIRLIDPAVRAGPRDATPHDG